MLDKKNKKGPKSDKPFRKPRKKICTLCAEKQDELDYKDIEKVKKFVSDKGKILPRRVTGTCAKHQRKVVEAIQRARHIALLPYSVQ
ncbi:MAG: 30S ribosomal protein S18 [Clostridia bacterium]